MQTLRCPCAHLQEVSFRKPHAPRCLRARRLLAQDRRESEARQAQQPTAVKHVGAAQRNDAQAVAW